MEKPNFRPYPESMTGYVSIVTDAHSNIGTAVSQILYHHGATVIMTCPTLKMCDESVERIKLSNPNHKLSHLSRGSLVPMVMDYNNINSIYAFFQSIKAANYSYINHLILNSNTYQHIYPSLGRNIIMYFFRKKKRSEKNIVVEDNTSILQIESENIQLSKFAVVKWLLPLLLLQPPSSSILSSLSSSSVAYSAMCNTTELVCSNNNIANNAETEFTSSSSPSILLPPSRIVYIGSSAYMSGTFPSSFFYDDGYIHDMASSFLGNSSSLNTSNSLNNEESYSNNNSISKNSNDNNSQFNHGRANLAMILQAHELQTRIDTYVYLQSLNNNTGISSNNSSNCDKDSRTALFDMRNNRINQSTSKSSIGCRSINNTGYVDANISNPNASVMRYRQVITSIIGTGNVAIINSNKHLNSAAYQNIGNHSSYYGGFFNTISIYIINFMSSLTSPTSTSPSTSWFTSGISATINTLFLRTADQVAYLTLFALCSNNYLPGSYFDPIGKSHDLFNYRDNGYLDIYLKAFFDTDSYHNKVEVMDINNRKTHGTDINNNNNNNVNVDEFKDTSLYSSASSCSVQSSTTLDDTFRNTNNITNTSNSTFQSPWHSSSPLPITDLFQL